MIPLFSLALVLSADPAKPPTCDAKAKGLAWNFGTYEAPNVRLCDGISFVPMAAPAPAPAPVVTFAPPAAAAVRLVSKGSNAENAAWRAAVATLRSRLFKIGAQLEVLGL